MQHNKCAFSVLEFSQASAVKYFLFDFSCVGWLSSREDMKMAVGDDEPVMLHFPD